MLLYIQYLECFSGHSVCPGIPIADRVAQQISFFVNQAEVYSPSIDTDSFDTVSFLCSEFQSGFHILEQGRKIPVNMISEFDLPVGKAVDFF